MNVAFGLNDSLDTTASFVYGGSREPSDLNIVRADGYRA
jgi:hypothetical protein